MAGLALAIDLLRKQQTTMTTTTTTIVSKGLHSFSTLNALAASAAASSAVSYLGPGSSSPAHFDARDWTGRVAYCDAAMVDADTSWEESEETIQCVPIRTNKLYPAGKKKYDIELEPLFSAFRPKAIGATTIKAVLVNSLPLLEAYLQQPEDDDEFEPEDLDRPARPPMDAVVPLLKRSVTHILCEVFVTTTRGILARVAVRHVTDRTAWKLLKDISRSVIRKAGRDLSPAEMFAAVCKTTFRAHALGVLVNWMVQLIMDFCGSVCVSCTVRLKAGKRVGLDSKELKRLAKRTAGETLKRSASLVLASVGAGLGTVLIGPSTGTSIGCFAGDLAGLFLVGPWLDTWIVYGTFTPGGLDKGQ